MGTSSAERGDAIKVIVADDSLLFREGLVGVLERARFEVVGQTADVQELETLVADSRPDIVILDIRMPPTQTVEGLLAARRIRERHPGVGVLMLSHHVETQHAMELLGQSPNHVGYLLKDRVGDLDEFIDAVRRVARGGSAIDPTVVSRLLAHKRSRILTDDLTDRERSVLALMAEGRSNEAISNALRISPKTLEAHIGAIYSKLGLEPTHTDHRRVLAVLNYLQSS